MMRVAIFILAIHACIASAQPYPTKPIRVVTASAGGGTDLLSRLFAQTVSARLGQQIVVENRSTVLTGATVAQSAPDGYTLILNGTSFWLAPLLQAMLPYDAMRDFVPISLLTTSPAIIVVHASLPIKNVKELIALARARPGEIAYGSSTIGAPTHQAVELFKSMAKVDLLRVSYKGNGPR